MDDRIIIRSPKMFDILSLDDLVKIRIGDEVALENPESDLTGSGIYEGTREFVTFGSESKNFVYVFTGCQQDSDNILSIYTNDLEIVGAEDGIGGVVRINSGLLVSLSPDRKIRISDQEGTPSGLPVSCIDFDYYLKKTRLVLANLWFNTNGRGVYTVVD